jgi:hypothetical protein
MTLVLFARAGRARTFTVRAMWLVLVVLLACGDKQSPPATVEVPAPKPPRGVVAYDDKEEPESAPAVDAVEHDAAEIPRLDRREAPANVDMKTELREIKRLLAKIMASRDPAGRRKVACEVAKEIDKHAFAARSVPDPKEVPAPGTLFEYRGEVDNLSTIAEDMIGHCKDNEPDGIDLDLEQMPRSFGRFVLLVSKAQRP